MEELGFPGGPVVKNLPANTGGTRDSGSILRSGKSPGVGNGNPLQHSCLENSMDRVSLAGYSPWGCKEMDTTEQQRACTHTHTHTHTHSPDISGFYAILFFTALDFHYQTHPQLSIISALSKLLHPFWSCR